MPMAEDWHRIATGVRYRGLEVTVIGNAAAGLLAIAGYGTRQELAIGAITVEHRDGGAVYLPVGARNAVASVEGAAEAVTQARQARDVRVATDGLT
jgi:L-serine deaminase